MNDYAITANQAPILKVQLVATDMVQCIAEGQGHCLAGDSFQETKKAITDLGLPVIEQKEGAITYEISPEIFEFARNDGYMLSYRVANIVIYDYGDMQEFEIWVFLDRVPFEQAFEVVPT